MFYSGEIPFVRLLAPLILGILAAYYYSDATLYECSLPLVGISSMLLLLSLLGYKKYNIYRYRWFPGAVLHIIILAAGYYLSLRTSQLFNKDHFRFADAQVFMATIITEPIISNEIVRFQAGISRYSGSGKIEKRSGKILLAVQADAEDPPEFRYGDVLLIPAVYDSIDPPFNPAEFNYRAYLSDRQIYHQAFLQQHQVHRLHKGRVKGIISYALELRRKLVGKFHQHIPDKDAAAFASTLILGYRAELSREIINAYSRTGTMHVLSVSGMHVGIVFLVLNFLMKFMSKTQAMRLLRAVLIISTIWFYAMLTGFSAPASRSAVMLSFIVLGKAINRNQNTYNLIAVSAFFLLLYNPFYLMDVGFQLSYLAVAGLVYFQPKIYQCLHLENRIADWVWAYCALSLAAQLATFPISIYYFHQFPVYFLLSNLVIVVPVALMMYAGILLMISPFDGSFYYLGQGLYYLISYTNDILFYIESLPWSSIRGIWIDQIQYMLLCLLMLGLVLRVSLVKAVLLPVSFILIVFCLTTAYVSIKNYQRKEIIFFNLKNHTAFASLNNGHSLVVSDLQPADKLMDFSVIPALQSRGSVETEFFDMQQSFAKEMAYSSGNFYGLAGYRILRWDRNFDKMDFGGTIRVDALLISGNPQVTIPDLIKTVEFNILIIDANNPVYKAQRWESEAREAGVPLYTLKKNQAYIVKL